MGWDSRSQRIILCAAGGAGGLVVYFYSNVANSAAVNALAINQPIAAESEYIRVFGSDDGLVRLEIAFDRQAFCEAITETDEVEVTIIGSLTTSRYFYTTDTIKIKPRR